MQDVQNGKPWYGTSVGDLLSRVEPHFAFKKLPHMPYTIAELFAHMIYWKQFVSDVLAGLEYDWDQPQSFSWKKYGKANPETWNTMNDKFCELNSGIVQCLNKNLVDPY